MDSRRLRQIEESVLPPTTERIVPRSDDVWNHFQEIVASQGFKRSRRSCEFLRYLIEKKLAGELDELKERTIGVQLFGRDPSYDTGEDAIVRVTATDVRRRLKRFYEEAETKIRLELPLGSYVISLTEQAAIPATEYPQPADNRPAEVVSQAGQMGQPDQISRPNTLRRSWLAAAALLVLGVSLGVFGQHLQADRANYLPWSAMRPSRGELKIVFSDPDIATLQGIAGSRISLADYAGHHYMPLQQASAQSSTDLARLFHGNNVPVNDTRIALNIRGLLASSPIETYPARVLQSQDFATEDNFILLGSPLSNPWVALFQDHLDFYFQYDPGRHEEVVYNRHVGHGETPVYAPTIPGWGTGQSYAIIGLFANPNQAGHILIVAGSNAAATDAAGRLVTDVESITRVLEKHGVDVHDRNAQFELLLRVSTMASSLSTYEVVACHRLS